MGKRLASRAKPAAKRKVPDTKSDPVLALADYWVSANHMHTLTHALKNKALRKTPSGRRPEAFREFKTYYCYWLSALYVVVEGFNDLRLDATKVPEIADPRVGNLKLFRNGCFHYQHDVRKQMQFIEQLDPHNWAERLHEKLGDFFADYLHHRVGVESAKKQ